jgi:hypothetical protein
MEKDLWKFQIGFKNSSRKLLCDYGAFLDQEFDLKEHISTFCWNLLLGEVLTTWKKTASKIGP